MSVRIAFTTLRTTGRAKQPQAPTQPVAPWFARPIVSFRIVPHLFLYFFLRPHIPGKIIGSVGFGSAARNCDFESDHFEFLLSALNFLFWRDDPLKPG
jgi:hypothetical protein